MNFKTKIFFSFLVFFTGYFVLTAFVFEVERIDPSEKVNDVLNKLGDEMPLHFIDSKEIDETKVAMGYNIVTTGYMHSKSKKQSKHFVCTDCHNIEREDPDLTSSDPVSRLSYITEKNINFLPGTTLFGQVNKKSWYNEDYLKKYGDLVVPARDTLENAIQLCAVVCSQGRALEGDEMEAVIHYFNSIGYATSNLGLSDSEISTISKAIEKTGSISDKKEAIRMIKSKYLNFSPATFMEPQSIESRGLGSKGNVENGKEIYMLSCMTCHKEGGVTNYKLSNEQLTHRHLKFWSNTDKVFSVYNITRKGTYSLNGYKPYMPNYTKERMSDQQLEDLMAYINAMADKGTIK